MQIYIDILFVENLIINYIILDATRIISSQNIKFQKLLLGAILGAVFAVVFSFLPINSIILRIVSKIFIYIIIIIPVFKIKTFNSFLSALASFYLTSFLFGGTYYALKYIIIQDLFQDTVTNKNSIKGVGFMISIGAACIVAIVIRTLITTFRISLNKNCGIVPISVNYKGLHVEIPALIDTGNFLSEPVSKLPVIIVELEAIQKILPNNMVHMIQDSHNIEEIQFNNSITEDWLKRFRVIPYSSIGTDSGLLPGFRPDSIHIGEGKNIKEISKVILALYVKQLSEYSTYNAIISPDILCQ